MTPLPLRRSWLVPPAMAVMLMMAGCATEPTYRVKLDSAAKAVPSAPQSFKIKNRNPAHDEENLRYKEAAEFVKTALSGKGLYEAPTAESADIIVELDYGIDAARTKTEHVKKPIYAEVGGGVTYEPIMTKRGIVNAPVEVPPRVELIGYENVIESVTVYEKYLKISARENKPSVEGQPPAELWRVQASAEDESKDLRRYLPVMASATMEYIGRDSANQQVKVREDSAGVEFVRKGMGSAGATAAVAPPPGS